MAQAAQTNITNPSAPSRANRTRRSVMQSAWSFQRTEPSRPFADCLRGAWKMIKGLDGPRAALRVEARRNGGRIAFSPMLFRSPIRRSLTGTRYAEFNDRLAGVMTSRMGR